MERRITLPLTEELAKTLKAGDSVLVTGTIYTSRDAGHKRMCEALARGEELPIDPKDATIYYVGPTPAKPGAVTFVVRDDKETIQSFYCNLTLNNNEFDDIILGFSEQYGSYEVGQFGDTIKTYTWIIGEENGKTGYDEAEAGYDDIVIQYNGDKEYTVYFSDEWSIIKDEAYYEATKENSISDEKDDSTVLRLENYDMSYGSTMLSMKMNAENKLSLSITANFKEDWQAAGFYTRLRALLNQLDSGKIGFATSCIVMGDKVMLSPIMSFYDSQLIDSVKWSIDQISTKEYDSEVISLIWDEFETKLTEFINE